MRPTNGLISVDAGLGARDRLVHAEQQRQVAVDALLLEDLGGADAFPGRRDLDQHAVARRAGGLVLRDQVAALLDRRRGVERQPGVDLGRHAARARSRGCAGRTRPASRSSASAMTLSSSPPALRLGPAQRAVDDVGVLGHLRRGGDQRRIGRRVARRELLDRVEVAGVAHRDRHRGELLEQGRHACPDATTPCSRSCVASRTRERAPRARRSRRGARRRARCRRRCAAVVDAATSDTVGTMSAPARPRPRRLEVMVLREVHPLGVEHEREALVAVRGGERAVDRDRAARLLDRLLALLELHRHVAVDDEAVRVGSTPNSRSMRAQNAASWSSLKYGFLVSSCGRLVGDEVGLERRHPVLAEARRAAARSTGRTRGRRSAACARCGTRAGPRPRARRTAPCRAAARRRSRHRQQLAALVDRHAAVEDRAAVAAQRHRGRATRRTPSAATAARSRGTPRVSSARHAASSGDSAYGSVQSIVGKRVSSSG